MTFTTVYRDYEGKTFEEAAAKALHDGEIFDQDDKAVEGTWRGYAIVSWSWKDGTLRVNFR